MSNQIEVQYQYPDDEGPGYIWVGLAGEVYTITTWSKERLDRLLDDWRAVGAKVHEE